MPNRPVRDQWEFASKMERHFPIKQGQLFVLLPNSLIRAKNRLFKNGTTNFGRNIPTEISGPPPEVIPNIPVGRNRNGLFHLNSNRNFRNLWHNGKHPKFPTSAAPNFVTLLRSRDDMIHYRKFKSLFKTNFASEWFCESSSGK